MISTIPIVDISIYTELWLSTVQIADITRLI